MKDIPLFPLNIVALPKEKIPLHIFNFMTPMKSRINGLKNCFIIAKHLKQISPHIIHSFNYSSDYSEPLAAKIAGIRWFFTKINMFLFCNLLIFKRSTWVNSISQKTSKLKNFWVLVVYESTNYNKTNIKN